MTYVPTRSDFLFLTDVLDVLSRRVVGCSIANHMRAELVVDELSMAIFRRKPDELGLDFSRRGKPTDNTFIESFNVVVGRELPNSSNFLRKLR